MRVLLRSLKNTYFTADPRSLGLFRVALALVLLWDLYRRYEQLDFWYTNSGLLPNHTLLWRPPAGHMFSLFFAASSRSEAELLFAASGVVYLCLLFGFRTRLAQVLALVCRVSVNSRLAVLENGGDMVINLLCMFSVVLPLGRRFSIDALRSALRDGRIGSADALHEASPPAIERTPVVSIAMFGLILQFAVIYFFNALSKQGEAWTSGDAVHYALHQDKFVTSLGVWMRENLSAELLRATTWSVLAVEWLGFALILAPAGIGVTRLIAVIVLPALHLSFALGLHLGTFSPAMMSFFPLLLTRGHWDAIGRWLERRTQAVAVEFDWNDARLFQRARVLAELDRFGRITFTPGSRAGFQLMSLPEGASPAMRARALLTALPWGFAVAWPLRLPGVRALWLRLLQLIAAGAVRLTEGRTAPPQPAGRYARAGRFMAEGAIGALMLAIASQITIDNVSVPKWLRFPQPEWVKAAIEYPRLLQGWRMFAPDPPLVDSMIYVDATTAEGVRVDPYNAVASRQGFPAGDVVPERMDQSQFFTMYSDRIADPNYAAYRQAFLEWILAYPQRTGRSADCLTSFEVYWVTDQSPPPGSHEKPVPLKRERFMHYVMPADSPCAAIRVGRSQNALAATRR